MYNVVKMGHFYMNKQINLPWLCCVMYAFRFVIYLVIFLQGKGTKAVVYLPPKSVPEDKTPLLLEQSPETPASPDPKVTTPGQASALDAGVKVLHKEIIVSRSPSNKPALSPKPKLRPSSLSPQNLKQKFLSSPQGPMPNPTNPFYNEMMQTSSPISSPNAKKKAVSPVGSPQSPQRPNKPPPPVPRRSSSTSPGPSTPGVTRRESIRLYGAIPNDYRKTDDQSPTSGLTAKPIPVAAKAKAATLPVIGKSKIGFDVRTGGTSEGPPLPEKTSRHGPLSRTVSQPIRSPATRPKTLRTTTSLRRVTDGADEENGERQIVVSQNKQGSVRCTGACEETTPRTSWNHDL